MLGIGEMSAVSSLCDLSADLPCQATNLCRLSFHQPEQPPLPGPLCVTLLGWHSAAQPSPARSCHAALCLGQPCPDHKASLLFPAVVAAPYTRMAETKQKKEDALDLHNVRPPCQELWQSCPSWAKEAECYQLALVKFTGTHPCLHQQALGR